jgi:hypothetical protein
MSGGNFDKRAQPRLAALTGCVTLRRGQWHMSLAAGARHR